MLLHVERAVLESVVGRFVFANLENVLAPKSLTKKRFSLDFLR
jgi:hypothetical protein